MSDEFETLKESFSIMEQLGFKTMGKAAPKKEVPEEVPQGTTVPKATYSRDVIIDAIGNEINIDPDAAEKLADEIIKALADKHLHIFKSKGSEL